MKREKIKVLYVMDHFFSPSGGTEGQIYNLIRNLNKKRFQPTMSLFRYTSNYFEKNNFPCPIISLNIKTFYSVSSYLKLWKLRRYIKTKKIDIIQTIFTESALTVPFVAYGIGSKIICSRRDMGFWYTPRKLFILRKLSPLVVKYLVNSYAVKKNVIEKEGIPDQKVEVIYNGHDFSRFNVEKSKKFREDQAIPRDSFIVGIVANFRPVKRVNDLIVAFCDVLQKHPNSYLVAVGDQGGLLDEYKKLAEKLKIQNNVRFLSSVKEIIPVMKHFNVGIMCSESEGMSNVIIEYMGCEIPVVATDTGGNAELIQNEETGLLVPVGKPKALASTISRLLENPDIGIKISQKARKCAEERFSDNEIIAQYEEFYKKLVRQNN